jgi:excisionase family DNA binding protein
MPRDTWSCVERTDCPCDGAGENLEMKSDSYLTTEEAAAYLKVAANSLAKRRVTGNTPRYFRWGRAIRYRREDLDAWMAERSARSTSEYATSKSPEAA